MHAFQPVGGSICSTVGALTNDQLRNVPVEALFRRNNINTNCDPTRVLQRLEHLAVELIGKVDKSFAPNPVNSLVHFPK